MRQYCSDGTCWAKEIGLHLQTHLVHAGIFNRTAYTHSSVVNQYIETPRLRNNLVDCANYRGIIGHI
ncbi:hypothetical protein D9M68_842960 [compost metagenome]